MKSKIFQFTIQIPLILVLMVSCNSPRMNESSDTANLHYDVPDAITVDSPTNFFGRPEEYLEWEAENTLRLVDEILSRFPPDTNENIVRYSAFQMLDLVYHDVEAPRRPAVQNFFHRRFANALAEMKATRVDEGAMIWKLYNMSIVARTASVTVCFDLVRAHSSRVEEFAVPDELMEPVIDQCDALFISHRHRDHADQWVAQAFIDQRKPVVAPPEVWEDEPIHEHITHLERMAHELQVLPVQSGQRELRVVVYPGHQGTTIQNNVPLVITPENISFVHTGDQSNDEDFEWIDNVGEVHHVDVYIPNTWTTDPQRAAAGYNPALILPAHENELGHVIAHREAYILNYRRWNVPYPVLMMAWGESFHYIPGK
jgi:L-ascorbate metabolism protein UlaG (beta-lactamase superfamily)